MRVRLTTGVILDTPDKSIAEQLIAHGAEVVKEEVKKPLPKTKNKDNKVE